MKRLVLVFSVLILAASVSADDGKGFKKEVTCEYLNLIAIHYAATASLFCDYPFESEGDKRFARDHMISTLPFWFDVFIAYDKFRDPENKFVRSYKREISKVLNTLTIKEITSSFESYFNPEFKKRTIYKWSVSGYDIKNFEGDFKEFLKLRKN